MPVAAPSTELPPALPPELSPAPPCLPAGDVAAAGRPKPSKPVAAKSAPQRALQRLGLLRDIDLALHLPSRYDDETKLARIAEARDGSLVQVQGVVLDSRIEQRLRRQLVVRLADDSGELVLRFLNFYPSQQQALKPGALVRARGEMRGGFFGREMVHPVFRPVTPDTPLADTLTPVYPAGAQLPQAWLRKAVALALARAPLGEVLPAGIVPVGLPSLRDALRALHHPPAGTDPQALQDRQAPAWLRLKFDELLAQQLSRLQAQRERACLRAPRLVATGRRGDEDAGDSGGGTGTDGGIFAGGDGGDGPGRGNRSGGPPPLPQRLLAALPFALTGAQQRGVAEIERDLAVGQPMHRLLQGDVGSGKTIVAALAAAVAIDAGWQCALMAPTELLATQHLDKLVGWLEPLGVRVVRLAGSLKGRARDAAMAAVADGSAQLVVGTHAVIQERVVFHRLGLAIVDEQHRFGVQQRLALRQKLRAEEGGGGRDAAMPARATADADAGAGPAPDAVAPADAGARADRPVGADAADIALEPHLLMMSATPIPRTLAMSYYADLAVSTIDELPPGRTPVVTKLFADSRRDEIVARIRDEAARGRQAYWVCPLIEESEALDLRDATETHRQLCEAFGDDDAAAGRPPRFVGLLHGRMAAAEKAAVMARFSAGELAVLVATTVIEVGVDVPNASLMVVEHAERFGLSQLHQLRGRVGRGAAKSACVLLYTPPLGPVARDRLKAMLETTDGFEIARRDLDIRGPGEFMGARQSGDALLRFADLRDDSALLVAARAAAQRLLDEHPQAAAAHVDRWLAGRAEYAKA